MPAAAIAEQVGELALPDPAEEVSDAEDDLTDHQRVTIRRLIDALPEPWRQRFAQLLDQEGDDGPTGALVPA